MPTSQKLEALISRFPLTIKVLLGISALVMVCASFTLLYRVNAAFLVSVPKQGGVLQEGLVGLPRFINPVLAVSDTDRDFSMLVYSGLMKASPSGDLILDAADSYTISDDGLTYTFTLKPDLYFHDGTSLTADDVVFTVLKAQDPLLKSPKRVNWDGVQVSKIDDRTIQFTLKQPYAPFLENMTLGILPSHIWKDLGPEEFSFSQFNIEPVGSGPYKIDSIKRNSSGLPTSYQLESFDDYALGAPYISNIIFRFYANDTTMLKAFDQKEFDSLSSVSPETVASITRNDESLLTAPLPRIFATFFNQNQNAIFTNREVRRALDLVTDKDALVQEVLQGHGQTINDPIPPGSKAILGLPENIATSTLSQDERLLQAQNILEDNGWVKSQEDGIYRNEKKKQELVFSLSTSDAPELIKTANLLKDQWQKFGASVDVKIFSSSDLNQNVIRTRQYQALLFGEVIGRDLDLYPFWHSSQRNDPGLNIAMYTNITADKAMEDIRTTLDKEVRKAKYTVFENEIEQDSPAVFLFSPDFIYLIPKKIQDVSLNHLTTPSERFLDINTWYVETENVWQIFLK
jgi:peptide/nickel transport system substrate-binding protein